MSSSNSSDDGHNRRRSAPPPGVRHQDECCPSDTSVPSELLATAAAKFPVHHLAPASNSDIVDSSSIRLDQSRLLFAAALAGVAASTILSVSARKFLFSSFLTYDDTIFLPRAAFDRPLSFAWRWELDLINWTGKLGGTVIWPKLLGIVMVGLTAAVLTWLLGTASQLRYSAAVGAVTISLFPISREPGVFVIGTHPFFAAPFAFAALHVVLTCYRGNRTITYRSVVIAAVLFSVAALMSPTGVLLIGAPTMLLVVRAAITRSMTRSDWACLAISVGWIAVVGPKILGYHYTGLQGWVSTSPSTALRNIRTSLEFIAEPVRRGGILAVSVSTLGLALVIAVATVAIHACILRRPHDASDDHRAVAYPSAIPEVGATWWFDVTALLGCAALAIIPGLAVVTFTPRYAALAFLFAAAAVALALARLIGSHVRTRSRSLAGVGLVALAVGSTLSADHLRYREFGGHLQSFHEVERLVTRESDSLPVGAQLVVVLDDDADVPSVGYNHWSTWLLRYLADRVDITGLVGIRPWLSSEPFVGEYRDQGPEYWIVRNGRSSRIRMKGLLKDAPTYTFISPSEGGDLIPSSLSFASGESFLTVPAGSSALCSQEGPSPTTDTELVWTISAHQLSERTATCENGP